jgi:chorismate dehydratase
MRVSFIEFLNAVPLGWGFLQGHYSNDVELLLDVPSRCAERLARGQADVGLIPVIEYQRIPGLTVVPGIAIAAKHEARSVLFLSRRRIEEVRTVALDSSSRTSAALITILLKRFYQAKMVEWRTAEANPRDPLAGVDGALLIGNPALLARTEGLLVYDLAAEWNRFTGLPFVFAFWAVRAHLDLGEQAECFYRSKRAGLDAIDTICRVYSERVGIPAEDIRTYLLTNLDYTLDEANQAGLRLFFSYAAELGLIPDVRPLEFHPVVSDTQSLRSR